MRVLNLVFVVAFLPLLAFGADVNELANKNAHFFGILTLVPPVIAIALAFITKDVIMSLFIGVLSGTFLLNLQENSFLGSFVAGFKNLVERAVSSMADSWNAGIILQVLCIGGVIGLITKMGGTKAVALWLSKRAKTGISAQISTWIMGIFVFFDDYANALIVGPIMRPITDKFKVSREKLAFIIDATAAPIAGIAIISTWIGFEISRIQDGYGIIGMDVNSYEIFIETIPYRFYNIFMLFFVICTAFMGREFGPMLVAERRARKGEVHSFGSGVNEVDENGLAPKDGIELKTSNAILPLLVLIFGSFASFYFGGLNSLEGDALASAMANPLAFSTFRDTFGAADASVALFQAALLASIVAIAMGVSRKIFTIKEGVETWVKGLKTMVITVAILILAWSLSSVIKELGTSKYLVDLLSAQTPRILLPTFIFILSSFVSFSTGTSYGTMGILMPLAIPLSFEVGKLVGLDAGELHTYMLMNISAVLTGAIFGDHCSPISDTTILSSMGAGCNHIDHVSTQIMYALSVCGISVVFGYLSVALGVGVWTSLLFGCLAVWLLVRFVGQRVDNSAV